VKVYPIRDIRVSEVSDRVIFTTMIRDKTAPLYKAFVFDRLSHTSKIWMYNPSRMEHAAPPIYNRYRGLWIKYPILFRIPMPAREDKDVIGDVMFIKENGELYYRNIGNGVYHTLGNTLYGTLKWITSKPTTKLRKPII